MTNLKPQTLNLEPKARPILFSTPMVQALLAGRKTQTRRIVKEKQIAFVKCDITGEKLWFDDSKKGQERIKCPYGKPGDLLWVRETWAIEKRKEKRIVYKARMNDFPIQDDRWRPSIHMPKAAARIWLLISEVRVERLQDITEADAKAEGIFPVDTMLGTEWFDYDGDGITYIKPVSSFMTLWASINGWGSVAQNPYVWVVSFEVVSTTGKPEFSPKMQTRL